MGISTQKGEVMTHTRYFMDELNQLEDAEDDYQCNIGSIIYRLVHTHPDYRDIFNFVTLSDYLRHIARLTTPKG